MGGKNNMGRKKKDTTQKIENKIKIKNTSNTSLEIKQKVIRVIIQMNFIKPLNGAGSSGKMSHLLRLSNIIYWYVYNGVKKFKSIPMYQFKSFKGAIHHQSMWLSKERGLEVCHSTDKLEIKGGKKLLPDAFHKRGECVNSKRCILHEVYGGKGYQSLFTVLCHPLVAYNVGGYDDEEEVIKNNGTVNKKQSGVLPKSAVFDIPVQQVHISTENRVNLTFDKISAQDFKERYISGKITFELLVDNCQPHHIGFLIETLMWMSQAGRGETMGTGQFEITEFEYFERKTEKKVDFNLTEGQKFKIVSVKVEAPLVKETQEALQSWYKYVGENKVR